MKRFFQGLAIIAASVLGLVYLAYLLQIPAPVVKVRFDNARCDIAQNQAVHQFDCVIVADKVALVALQ